MRSSTVKFLGRIPAARWAPLLFAAAIGACSSNSSSTGGTPVRVTLVIGGGVSATVGTAIGPIVVRVTDVDTVPVAGVQVTFSVNAGADAVLSTTSAATDQQGQVLTSVTLGHAIGTITITATAAGVATPVVFQETGVADAPTTMIATGGNNQTGPMNSPLADPVTVSVTDQFGNPVSGVTITWTTTGGLLSVGSSRTNAAGTAQTQLTLPGVVGPVTITGSALIGGTTKTVNFTATAN